MKLSPHFSLAEMTKSATGESKGLKNEPNATELVNIRYTAGCAELVRSILGNVPISITSCFRSDAVNKAVGGSATSAHRYGLAIDMTASKYGTPYEIANKLVASKLVFDQIIVEFPDANNNGGAWLHIGFANPANRASVRKQCLTATKLNRKTTYRQGFHDYTSAKKNGWI